MGGEAVVDEGGDVGEVEVGGGVGVEHGGVVDVVVVAGEGGFGDEGPDVDVGLDEGGELGGQVADVGGVDAVAVDEAGDFDAAVLGDLEVGDGGGAVAADLDRPGTWS